MDNSVHPTYMPAMKPSPPAPFLSLCAIHLLGNLRSAISSWSLCAFLLLATLHPMRAATINWVGQSGDWSTAANWSTGAFPVQVITW